MNTIENIKKRKSWRTYKKESLSEDIIQKIEENIVKIHNGPFGNSIKVYFFKKDKVEDAKLGTYGMIKNAQYFLGGKTEPEKEAFLDYGYIFERIVLFLTELDLGTCWLGGTFSRSNFRDSVDIDDSKIMPAVIATGYPQSKRSLRDKLISFNAGSHKRKAWDKLFFHKNSDNKLEKSELGKYSQILEMIRIAPSASNLQPWRIIKDENKFHFFLKRKALYNKIIRNVDLQMIDMGIAMYHFEATATQLNLQGKWEKIEHQADKDWEYIISWIIE